MGRQGAKNGASSRRLWRLEICGLLPWRHASSCATGTAASFGSPRRNIVRLARLPKRPGPDYTNLRSAMMQQAYQFSPPHTHAPVEAPSPAPVARRHTECNDDVRTVEDPGAVRLEWLCMFTVSTHRDMSRCMRDMSRDMRDMSQARRSSRAWAHQGSLHT
jgi:hypothetical protein